MSQYHLFNCSRFLVPLISPKTRDICPNISIQTVLGTPKMSNFLWYVYVYHENSMISVCEQMNSFAQANVKSDDFKLEYLNLDSEIRL
jgi:hypothetical protein